jgi:hypothetical protein
MDVVAHRAGLLREDPSHVTMWRAAAARGNPDAAARLESPPFPESLEYLDDWFSELSSTRGAGMHSIAPVTQEQIKAWRENNDVHPEPHEVRALLALDAVFRSALAKDPAKAATEPDAPTAPRPAWRDRAPGVEPVFQQEED